MQAGIIGLGLMGGSMGLALKETKMFKTVVGMDASPIHTQQALFLGLVDECVTMEEMRECDVIFLAIPVDSIIETLQKLPPLAPHVTVIDLGSTKRKIVESVPSSIRRNFVPAHPMCGTENFGPKAAFKELYQNRIVVLTDIEGSGEFQRALAKEIFIRIGMNIVKMDSASHDRHAAFISHLPHIISYALANTVLSQEDPQSILALAAGGFRDMSRIAQSSARMWTDVSKQNKEELLQTIDFFGKEMILAEQLIKEERWEELYEWMEKANTLHHIL
ncbi:prephenate dehydrogenase [Wolinella succinogenes]|nr:prephenate dehydrogenase [Wolinella succinogenes]VEG81711.1 Arogenate dehydrogenase [Wolinella succinogenes]HCZ18383.1 prephenate dehydrogenase [Helicobacter sp.]